MPVSISKHLFIPAIAHMAQQTDGSEHCTELCRVAPLQHAEIDGPFPWRIPTGDSQDGFHQLILIRETLKRK
jgi:hypothetical protein